MKKLLILGGIVGVCVIAGFLLLTGKEVEAPEPSLPLPTIIVESGEVKVVVGEQERVLSSEEQIAPPFSLKTGVSGVAIVRLQDNSELRMRENSELTVTEASYIPENGTVSVHTKLSIGRVWSNIIALVTPESKWEVETSNVVATVRGTAFDVETTVSGTTTITGSEHTIELTLKDPDTGVRDENRKLKLGEDEVVVIGKDDAKDTKKPFPTPRKRTDAEKNDPWVKKNEGHKEERLTPPSTSDGSSQDTPENQNGSIELLNVTPTSQTPTPSPSPAAATPTPKPVSVNVMANNPLTNVTEGTTITFTAVLVYSDTTKRYIGSEVTWGVVGKIGSMNGALFTAKLDPSVSEYGRSFGAVSATWVDPQTGTQYYGATEPFEVKARVVDIGTQG